MDWRQIRCWQGIIFAIKRISIADTRVIIEAIHDGSLAKAEYGTLPVFNLAYPKALKGVDPKILNPIDNWSNKEEYKTLLNKVADMFNKNFKRFENDASAAVKKGAPKVVWLEFSQINKHLFCYNSKERGFVDYCMANR